MDVRNWGKGVEIVGDVVSLKILDNFIHDNLGAGLQVNSGVTIGGVINVYGNLFKVNVGNGIQNDGVTNLPALYNSWGDIDGSAAGTGGDGVSGNVDASRHTFLEYFMDMDPDTLATSRRAASGSSFDVMLKGDARKVNGIAFKLTYNAAVLQLNSATYQGTWAGAGASCLTRRARRWCRGRRLLPHNGRVGRGCRTDYQAQLHGADSARFALPERD